jgi:transcriptional regulator with XRE-family HTH domain
MIERGERLKFALQKQRVPKLLSLAIELGVDESTICRWTKGGNISLANIVKLCKTLDISADWLLLGRGNMNNHKHLVPAEAEKDLIKNLRNLNADQLESSTILFQYVARYLSESSEHENNN